MPNYAFVPIKDNLNALKAQIDRAKSDGSYAGTEAEWDRKVKMILEHNCTIAESHRTKHRQHAVAIQNQCKQLIEDIETQLKKKTLIAGEYNWIEKQPAEIERISTGIHDDSVLMVKAILQYREGWPDIARECLEDIAILRPYQATRKKGIDTTDSIPVGLQKRCAEYVVRAKELVKIARQRQNDGKVDVDEFNNDMAEIKTKMEKGRADIEELLYKRNRTITWYEDMGKKKTWLPEDVENADGFLAQFNTAAKAARGILKTLTLQLEGLEKRGKASGPGWKDLASKAVKEARDALAAAKAASETMDSHEKKCAEVVKKMKK